MRAPPLPDVLVLKGGHLVDPSQGIDGPRDIVIQDGRVLRIGDPPADAEVLDITGRFVSPGWIDIHVHLYGNLGFADPDSIGVAQGVTTFVDAGGPGIGTLDEFCAALEGRTVTTMYAGAYLRPLGLIGVNHVEGDIRALNDVPIAKWLDFMQAQPGLIRYLKIAALGSYGTGPLKIGKGLSEILGVPLYSHIGEFQQGRFNESAYEIFRICVRGDIITHNYHGNPAGILDAGGKVLPVVEEAAARGVLLDVGFGGYNFSWRVAEAALNQGFLPDIISSDLQQFNVLTPVKSLSNVMTCFLSLGMTLQQVIARVTAHPAEALGLQSEAGSLRPSMPADITVFDLEDGETELVDAHGRARSFSKRIRPAWTFKGGRRIACDLDQCQDERNWIIQIAEDHVPAAARELSGAQRAFLRRLSATLAEVDWRFDACAHFDLDDALRLQAAFHQALRDAPVDLKHALNAVFACFLDEPFAVQIGLFLVRFEKAFVLERLAVCSDAAVGADA